jgi:hypothetical protein
MSRLLSAIAHEWKIFRAHPKATLFTIVAVALIVVGAGLSLTFYTDLQERQPVKIAPLAKHADIKKNTLETFAHSLTTPLPADMSTYPDSACAPLGTDWVKKENIKPGVKMTMASWHNFDIANPRGSVLWLDQTSVSCGQTIGIHASSHLTSEAPTGKRTFEALRIGWYRGSGARLVWKSKPIQLKIQKTPIVKKAERMVQTNWKATLKFTVGKDWVPGFYLIASISPKGAIESVAPLVVRSPLSSSKLVLVHSTITWAAYNTYGGRSLYLGPGGSIVARRLERSRIVSMDRPIEGSGALHLDRDGITLVQFLEKEGINTDQIADTDLHQWPSISTHYNGIVFSSHPEYFTRRMFDTITADRNQGINLAFLGANNAYWQTRLDPSPTGQFRHVIVYRKTTEDPVTSNRAVTVEFQDPHVNTPPNLLTGALTNGVHVYGNLHSVEIPKWLKIPSPSHIYGVSGDTEIDATVKNAAEPPNVHILFTGKLDFRDTLPSTEEEVSKFEKTPIEQTVWFTTPSGAAVFDAGLTTWACNLLPSCVSHSVMAPTETVLQSVTRQVLSLWQTKAVGGSLK